MIKDANVSPDQEINYLRSYTKEDAQRVINNYRQRQYRNPADALSDVLKELERRFGNTAAITNVLLVRLQTAAKFGEEDIDKLQAFADVYADVDRQLDFLPGLGCLNYLTTIGHIVENLPHSLRSKWERRVVQYAEKYDDAYPSFKDFAAMVQEQARLRNHPNVLAAAQPSSRKPKGREHRQRLPETDADPTRRVLRRLRWQKRPKEGPRAWRREALSLSPAKRTPFSLMQSPRKTSARSHKRMCSQSRT